MTTLKKPSERRLMKYDKSSSYLIEVVISSSLNIFLISFKSLELSFNKNM